MLLEQSKAKMSPSQRQSLSLSSTRKPEVQRLITTIVEQNDSEQPPDNSQQQYTTTWSGPTHELFGYHLEDIKDGEDWWLSHIHPEDRDDVMNSLSEHLAPASGHPYDAEARIWGCDYRFQHREGYFFLASDRGIITRDDAGKVMKMVSVVSDKEKRRVERKGYEQLLNSQNHLATIANNTPSGIFMMDPQGYTTYMNAAGKSIAVPTPRIQELHSLLSAEQITGFKYEEIYDYTFHAAVHSCYRNGDPYPLHECPVFRHQQEGTLAKNESEVFVHKDGHHYGKRPANHSAVNI